MTTAKIKMENPIFKVLDYVSRKGERNYRISRSGGKEKRVDMRVLGVLRGDGEYTPINALDYYSHMMGMRPRKNFAVGLPTNAWIQEHIVARLNEACAEEEYPPISVLRKAYNSVFREALGLIRGKPISEAQPTLHPANKEEENQPIIVSLASGFCRRKQE